MKKRWWIFLLIALVIGSGLYWGKPDWKKAVSIGTYRLGNFMTMQLFPALFLYEGSFETALGRDLGLVFLPGMIAGEEIFAISRGEEGVSGGKGELPKEDEGTSGGVNAGSGINGNGTNGSGTTGSGAGEGAATPEGEKPSGGEEVSAFPALGNVVKQQEIHREKLKDFDYLRQNFYQIDSSTTISGRELDADTLLGRDLSLKAKGSGPQILIYHTHSQEEYLDPEGTNRATVVEVGDYLAQLLEEIYGVAALHHKGTYDLPNRNQAYSRALPEIQKIIKENPSIEVVIDLHRDGVNDAVRLVSEVNGKKTAKIMFFNGLSRTTKGEITYLKNPYIQENLSFSLQMQVAAEEYFPLLARKIYLKGYRYNMHLCPKSLLVEVGAQTNTIEEAKNAMEPLAFLLAKVLKMDKVP